MGFSNHDDIIRSITNGKFYRFDWNKCASATTAHVIGEWYDLYQGAGMPVQGAAYGTGTNKAFQVLDETVSVNRASGIPHGGNVSPDTKHILNASVHSGGGTSGLPATLMLIDILGWYPITTVTTIGDQALDNTTPFPARHDNGRGLRAFVVPSTTMGAATPNIRITYTNQNGIAGKLTPSVLPVGRSASPVGHIVYSGLAAAPGKYGPFLPLAAGDCGIQSVQQFNLSASYVSGVLNLVICRPLFSMQLTTAGITSERDLVSSMPSLPRVYDGSVLSWLMFAGTTTPASTGYYGHLDFGWG